MGSQSKNFQFLWYDDVSVVAIPQITDVAVSGGTVTINFLGAVSEQASDFTLLSASTVKESISRRRRCFAGSGGSSRRRYQPQTTRHNSTGFRDNPARLKAFGVRGPSGR